MASKKKASSKRELIDTGADKRYVRRDEEGQFEESDDVGRSLSQNVKKKPRRKYLLGKATAALKNGRSSQAAMGYSMLRSG